MSNLTGSSADILDRVKKLIPRRWFAWSAPYRDALMGGLSDSAAWNYTLIFYAKAQTRLASAYGIWLDILCFDFLGSTLTRGGLSDGVFRAIIKATILQERVTRKGMIAAVTTLTGNAPTVFEPWNSYDTGAYSGRGAAYGSMGYGVGRGGYGNMNLPGQAFLQVTRGAPSGLPNVGGYGNTIEGYGVGQVEYAGSNTALIGVTNDIIYKLINLTKPTGTTAWTAIGAPPPGSVGNGMPKRPCIMNSKASSQNIAII